MRRLLGVLVALAFAAPASAYTFNDDQHPVSDAPYRIAHQFLPWSITSPGPAPRRSPAVSSPFVPPPGTCPNGVLDANDGCAGANANSTVKLTNFFTTVAPQTGQTYFGSGSPQTDGGVVGTVWNVAGVDYPVGPYTARNKANDPQAPAFSLGTNGSYIAGTVLTVTGAPAATLNFGHVLTGSTVTFGTEIIGSSTYGPGGSTSAATCGGSACTGAGGAGTYLVSISQTVGSSGSPVTLTAHNFPANTALTTPTGSAGDYGLLTCSGTWSGNYTWENVDFGAVNGHGPTILFCGIGQVITFTLQDYWITNAVGSTTGNCLSQSVNLGSIIFFESVSTANLVFKWGEQTPNSACRYILDQGTIVAETTGSVSFEYNDWENTEGLPIGLHPGQNNPSDFSFNVFHNWGYGEWQSHAEIDGIAPVQNTLLPNFTIGYNTAYNDAGGPCACATTNLYLTGGVNGFNFNQLNVARNVLISNPVSGTTNFTSGGAITYTFSASSSGTPVGPGPYLVVTGITCGGACASSPYVLQGMTITDNNIEIGLDQCLSGCTNTGPNSAPKGGVGSVWTAPCSIANVICPAYGVTNAGLVNGCTPGTSTNCNKVSLVTFDFKSNNTAAVVSAATAGATTLVFSGPIPGCTPAASPTGLCNTTWTVGSSARKGQFVFDVTNPTAIPANTVATCVANPCTNSVTISNAVTSPGVSAGDIIEFKGLGCVSGVGFCTATLSDLISVFGPQIEQSHSSIALLSITGNLFDTTGVGGGPQQAIDGNGTCGSPATLAGNLNLIGGGSVNTWTVNNAGC